MTARSLAALVAFAVVLSACGPALTHTEQPQEASSDNNDTTLGAGDTFDVRVYDEQGLTNTYQVSPDGTIDYPFIGRIEVAGLEPTQVADLLRTRLQDGGFIRQPQVSVVVKEYVSKRVSVTGSVTRPGTFPMSPGLTLVQAVSLAGGFTPLAARNDTVVTRRMRDGRLQRFHVPVDRVMQGRAEDFALRAGDIINVPERIF